jgi:lipid A 4'-phosphatase
MVEQTTRAMRWWHRPRQREVAWWLFYFALASLVFSVWPSLDLAVTSAFYLGHGQFAGKHQWWIQIIYRGVPVAGWAAFVVSCWWAWSHWRGIPGSGVRLGRRGLALAVVLLLGVGLVVHGAFKEQWGRARPVHILEFGGRHDFTPPLEPSNACETNCSFVSGHAASGFVLLAVGLMGAPAVRRHWWRIGMLAGGAVGLVRVIQGGHFLSDVVFSGLAVWGTALLVRTFWLRWRLRRYLRRHNAQDNTTPV